MNNTFENAEQEFLRLKGQLAAGRITPAQFDAALKELIVEDAQGKFWMLGADSGKWYVHDGQSWVEATPPGVAERESKVVPVSSSQATPPSSAPPTQSQQTAAQASRRLKTIVGTVGGGLLTLLVGLAATFGQNYVRTLFLGGSAQPTFTATATLLIASGSTLTPTPTNTLSVLSLPGLSPTVTGTISQTATAAILPTASPTILIPTITPIPAVSCPGPPVIVFFTASPQVITAGQSTTLSWGSVTNASSAVIDQGIGGVPTPGSRALVLNGTTTFTLSASGCGGTTTSQVRVTVNPAPTITNTPLPPTPQFVWDFTPCNNQSTTSSGNFELFDPGQVYGGSWVGNGCAVRFKTGGSTSMQATFNLTLSPQTWSPRNATILIYHLSSLPGNGQAGYSPVQVTLNGATVYQGSPGPTNTGPGNLWAANTAIVTSMLRQGSNTLRWDYLNGATTHYWLKSFRISW